MYVHRRLHPEFGFVGLSHKIGHDEPLMSLQILFCLMFMEDRVKKGLGEIWTHKTTFEMTQSCFVSIGLIDDMINVLSDSK